MKDRFILLAKIKIINYALLLTYLVFMSAMILEQVMFAGIMALIIMGLFVGRVYYDIRFVIEGMKGENVEKRK